MLTSNQRFARNMVAHQKVKKAITRGELERSDICELCGKSPDPIEVYGRDGEINYRHPIFAHHWNGHKNALDVWWICQTCNAQLRGDEFHCGQITKEEARQILHPREIHGDRG